MPPQEIAGLIALLRETDGDHSPLRVALGGSGPFGSHDWCQISGNDHSDDRGESF